MTQVEKKTLLDERTLVDEEHRRVDAARLRDASAGAALAVAALGFFIVTLDALVVNVALPSIGRDLGGSITGLQWVVDGYTLLFAALLLTARALSDRIGARRAFGVGLVTFVAASAACGLAPGIGVLVAARLAQGAGAAVIMPSSLALIRESYHDGARRARAIALWSLGGRTGGRWVPDLAHLAGHLLHQPACVHGGAGPPRPGPALATPDGAVRLGGPGNCDPGDGCAVVRPDRGRR